MAKVKTRDALADHIRSLKEKRELYKRAGKDTRALDTQLERLTGQKLSAAPQAPAGGNTPTPGDSRGSDSGSAGATPSPTTVENKALPRDDEDDAKDREQRENKAVPQSKPTSQTHKPGPRPGQGGNRGKG